MRKFSLVAGIGGAMAVAAVGIGVAYYSPSSTPVKPAAAVANADVAATPDPASVVQRRDNEALDGDPATPGSWGPAQAESFQVAARAVFDQAGVTTGVSARRVSGTDNYEVVVRAAGGADYLVTVDYVNFTAVSVAAA